MIQTGSHVYKVCLLFPYFRTGKMSAVFQISKKLNE